MKLSVLQILLTGMMTFIATSAIAAETKAVVMFDQGHSQRFTIQNKGELHLSKLAEIIGSKDVLVTPLQKTLNDESLSGVTALVISGPFAPLTTEETAAVVRFVEKGGRLAVMLHIGQPLTELLARLEIDFSNVVLHERQNIIDSDINFQVKDLTASALFTNVPYFSLYGGWALDPGSKAQSLARTSAEAWADLDGNKKLSDGDVIATFSVVVEATRGAGKFIVFGDDAIFQNRFLDTNNSALASNLGNWLAGK